MDSIGAPRGVPLGRSKRGYASAYATAGVLPAPEGKLGEWVSVAPGGLVGSKTFYSRDQPGTGRTCRRELFTAGDGWAVHEHVGLQACQEAVGSGLHVVVMVPRRLEGIHALLSLVAGKACRQELSLCRGGPGLRIDRGVCVPLSDLGPAARAKQGW